jgi:phosphatidylinositol glycan class O
MAKATGVYVGLLCILLWLAFLHGTSLLGFSDGYLKTRAHLDKHSNCEDVHELYTLPDKTYLKGLGVNESCWNRRRFERVVVLLIDSLRFDFCVMDPDYKVTDQLEGHAFIDPGDEANIVRHYKNRLPVINETLWNEPNNARLFRFLADPPTATMQRIKALTTGSMPTFLEVSDNFASEAIHDDNWVVQMGKAGRKAVFMGDDTWMSMYPTSFAKAYPYPSFEVRDLHTVDLGVQRHLIPEIKGETFGKEGWHLILGHMLGVDHVGHRLGSNHPEMASKLAEMNIVISKTLREIDDSTLFIVLSDHGMNYEGNHGGATLNEMSASLFFYTAKKDAFADPLLTPLPNPQQPHVYGALSQIDIVPTISMLLGAPIPYGSLGMIIPELFWENSNPSSLLDPLHVNSAQLLRYLSELEKNDNRFPVDEMRELKQRYNDAVAKHSEWQLGGIKSVEKAKEVYDLYKAFHEKAVDLCRRLWTTFDTDKMELNFGLALITALIPGILACTNARVTYRIMLYVSVGLFWAPLTYLVGWKSQGFPLTFEWLLFVVQWASVASFAVGLIVEFDVFFPNLSFSRLKTFFKTIRFDLLNFLAGFAFLVLLVIRCVSITSNSFIINAQQTNTFMTSSLIAFLALITWRNGNTRVAFGLFVALCANRVTYHTFAGRHENYFTASTALDLAVYTIAPMLAIAWFAIRVVRRWLNADVRLLVVFLCPQFALAVYWTVQAFGMLEQYAWVRLGVPRAIFGSTLLQLVYVAVVPFFKVSSVFSPSLGARTALTDSTDGGMTEFHTDGKRFAVHSAKFYTRAAFVRVVIGVLPTVMLILGPASPLPIFTLLLTGFAIASAAVAGLHTTPTPRLSLLALLCLLWAHLAYTYFYATSHLPVITALQMSAAFIGYDHFSLYYGGFLVGFNAFFSHFLLALAVPILGCNLFHFDEMNIQTVILLYNFIYSSFSVANCGASYMHRRHLFVWTVFAPFFIFETVTLFSVDAGLLIGTCIALASLQQTAPKAVLKTVTKPRKGSLIYVEENPSASTPAPLESDQNSVSTNSSQTLPIQ